MSNLCCGKTRGTAWRQGSCSRKARPGSKFCAQHDPANIEAKHQARKAKWEEESRIRELARQRNLRQLNFDKAAKAALEEIAAGHNDPRRLAKKTLKILEP